MGSSWKCVVLIVMLGCLLASCLPPAPRVAGDGMRVHGFIGTSSTMPAAGVTVKLVDGQTGGVVDIAQTNFFGKYSFAGLHPGHYRVVSGEVEREVMVKNADVRLDIDLSAQGGAMDYGKSGVEELKQALAGQASAAAGKPVGPNDPNLMRQFSGEWYSFSSAGVGLSGGTERKLLLCPDGRYFDSAESGYSGGAGTSGAWGTANQQSGGGNWAISGGQDQGTMSLGSRTAEYSVCGNGCLYIDGVKYGYAGAGNCQ